MRGLLTLLTVTTIGVLCTLASAQNLALLNVSVADLRSEPQRAQVSFGIDRLQLTQLLYGEPVEVIGAGPSGWYLVRALHQHILVNGTWQPYQGYVEEHQLAPVKSIPRYNLVVQFNWLPVYSKPCTPKGCLPQDQITYVSIGTLFEAKSLLNGWYQVVIPPSTAQPYEPRTGWVLAAACEVTSIAFVPPLTSSDIVARPASTLRESIVATSQKLLGYYYLWGGRSAFNDHLFLSNQQITGVDCSGLVSISYKAHGILLPRDADPMFRASRNVTGGAQQMQPGDLFFTARPSNPNRITHVMMMLDSTRLIESAADPDFDPDPTNGTRIVDIAFRFGAPLHELQWGKPVRTTGSILYWGSMFD